MLLELALSIAVLGPKGPAVDTVTYNGVDAKTEIETPSVERAGIDVDGRLDDSAWESSALLTSFTQFDPVEGAAASQRTEVQVIVDADAIYFGIKAYDEDPNSIRATLAERDSYTRSDDYIRVILDTFNDSRRAYVFTVNPLGVQHDGIWNEGGGSAGRRGNHGDPIDVNPDFLWESEGNLTEWGYQAEIRIPFKSLRFPELAEQSWGLQVERNIQRNGYKSSWAPLTANVASRLAQNGKLNGLRNLDMGMFMEINPVVTGKRLGTLDDLGVFGHDDSQSDFGLNATYGVTSDLTLDATYNPDFSQVEADAGQISVNERFALFFPEKRPFFLEGTEIFGMAKQLIYTRSVANPVAGAKLSGKVAGLSIGYLGAVDESFDRDAPKTLVNLLRVRKDVGASSTIGAVYTDRSVNSNEYNRVAGADARFQVAGRYTFTAVGATSFTDTPDLAGRETGRMLYAQAERAGRTMKFSAQIEDTDSDFNAGSGFFNRVGDTQIQSRTEYNWFGDTGAFLEQFGGWFEAKGYWDHEDFWDGDGMEEGEVQLGWRLSLQDNISFWGTHQRSMFSFAPESYNGLFAQQANGSFSPFQADQSLFENLGSTMVSLWVNKWERVRGNVRYTLSETPIFDRTFGVAVELADSRSTSVTLNLYPVHALVMELGLRQTTLTRKDGVEASSAIIPRIRAQYQLSRALFVRGIFEYSSQERVGLRDPESGMPLFTCTSGDCTERVGFEGYDFHIEGLVSYEPSPGTVFYVGYTRQMEDTGYFRFREVKPQADGLFIKLSYRFRR